MSPDHWWRIAESTESSQSDGEDGPGGLAEASGCRRH